MIVIANPVEYEKQRELVRQAIMSFLGDPDLPVVGTGLTGSFMFVQERGEWWFETWTRWDPSLPGSNYRTIGWAHVFADLAEFDRITGSPDHPDSFGFRLVETATDALKGAFE